MLNQPGVVRDNPLTRAMDYAKALNQERGALAGKVSGTPIIGGSSPSVRSANMQAPPLTPEEIAERNKLAIEAGVNPEDLPNTDEEYLIDGDTPVVPTIPVPVPRPMRTIVRENQPPRIPDFKNVQGIDFHRNVAYVDGFEITIPEEHIKDFKLYVIRLAVDYVTEQLARAIAEVNPPEVLETTDGRKPEEEVRETTG